jgi:hypothetical protein
MQSTRLFHLLISQLKYAVVGPAGSTAKYKSTLKESGFKWSRNKKMWYFRPENQKRRFFRGSSSIDEIRIKYGSKKVAFRYRKALA